MAVAFDLIPAIDVSKGELARLDDSISVVSVDAFGGDPVAAARAFVDQGAAWLHVVDLDFALTGRQGILEQLAAITAMPVSVQASGGIVRESDLRGLLAAGAARVVLGSAALADRGRTEDLVEEFGPRLVVAVESDGTAVRPRGTSMELSLGATLSWLAEVGATRFMHVRVPRAGGPVSPDLEGITALVNATGGPVIASGGFSNIGHLHDVAAINGVEGAIVGTALYEGGLSFPEAVKALKGSEQS